MKVKALITDDDYVVNPTEQLFGDRIPKFTFPESGNAQLPNNRGTFQRGFYWYWR